MPRPESAGLTLQLDAEVLGDRRSPTERAARMTAETLVIDGAASLASMPFMRASAEALAAAMPRVRHQALYGQSHEVDPADRAPCIAPTLRVKALPVQRQGTCLATPTDVDTYIDNAPSAAQPLLHELRSLILTTVPDASERISYAMPTTTIKVSDSFISRLRQATSVSTRWYTSTAWFLSSRPDTSTTGARSTRTGEPLPADALRKALCDKANTLCS